MKFSLRINSFWSFGIGIPGKLLFLMLIAGLVIFSGKRITAQSLPGTTGYFNIPSAEIYPDKTMYFGTNVLNRNYKKWGSPDYHAMDFFVTTSYIPFAEISIRFTRVIDMPDSTYQSTNGDRMVSVRFQLFKEGKYHPSIVIGFQNFFTTLSTGDASHFNSIYLAATKNFRLPKIIHNIGITAGYGYDLFEAVDYQFLGLFGGISITPRHLEFMDLMLEYDGGKWNAGARITILKHLILLVGLEGMDAFSGGVSYRFCLP